MFLKMLSTDNYVSYNVQIANLFGLHIAIYLTELININEKAKQKEKIDNEGFFKLNREYIKNRTTFKMDEQRNLDKTLSDLKIIEIKEKDFINLNIDVLVTILNNGDIKLIENIEKIIKPTTDKRTKIEVIKDNLKNSIVCDNDELLEAYKGWIDGVLSNPNGFLSISAIKSNQKILNNYTKGDLDVALEVLEIATISGYRDLSWAITEYEKRLKNKVVNNKPTYETPTFNKNIKY